MRIDHFEHGLKRSIKTLAVGHNYLNFKEMYQNVVKIARVIDENEVEEKNELYT